MHSFGKLFSLLFPLKRSARVILLCFIRISHKTKAAECSVTLNYFENFAVFWFGSRIRIIWPDPDPLQETWIRIRVAIKNSDKLTLNSTNIIRIYIFFFLLLYLFGSTIPESGSADPDPHQIKWIRNTANFGTINQNYFYLLRLGGRV